MKLIIQKLLDQKKRNEKITMLSCHDFPTADLAENSGVDILLVGDSLGVKILGYSDSREVTFDDMFHHFKAINRARKSCPIIVDLPISSLENAKKAYEESKVLVENGADFVKIEGYNPNLAENLQKQNINVCFDIIYPHAKSLLHKTNSIEHFHKELFETIIELSKINVKLFILTMFPQDFAYEICNKVKGLFIGVGSGNKLDGQVLIASEMLGLSKAFGDGAYNKKYAELKDISETAFKTFIKETKLGLFPTN